MDKLTNRVVVAANRRISFVGRKQRRWLVTRRIPIGVRCCCCWRKEALLRYKQLIGMVCDFIVLFSEHLLCSLDERGVLFVGS